MNERRWMVWHLGKPPCARAPISRSTSLHARGLDTGSATRPTRPLHYARARALSLSILVDLGTDEHCASRAHSSLYACRYAAFSRCAPGSMKFDFELSFLNDGTWWNQQFSVDQQGTHSARAGFLSLCAEALPSCHGRRAPAAAECLLRVGSLSLSLLQDCW
jgi:hypothetical protein